MDSYFISSIRRRACSVCSEGIVYVLSVALLDLIKVGLNLFCYLLSCDTETDIDNGIFNMKADEDTSGGSDFDRESGFSPTSSPSEQQHSVASYVAKHRHTVTVHDIRRPDSRFPAGSICLHVC